MLSQKIGDRVHVPNFWQVSGSEDRGGGDSSSNSLILVGWVMAKVLEKGDKNGGGGEWKGG